MHFNVLRSGWKVVRIVALKVDQMFHPSCYQDHEKKKKPF